ncbi:hypothetical protein [Listeria newyorkensis]|uniref:Antitoxin n=1 Tax=Listeria newyorkensis TaxID=1497681 RepID=A0A841YZE8_9LIST|nr:hypothetical protein [Listeria newyorkensis]MBC1458688.1 hypothetical protein [Listeria newyorkensis]
MMFVEPSLKPSQLVSTSEVNKEFSKIKKQARSNPIFVSNKNQIDTVILSYDDYLAMYNLALEAQEMEYYKQAGVELQAIRNGTSATVALDLSGIPDDGTPDAELFE